MEICDDKNSIIEINDDKGDIQWRRHLLYAGTIILQHNEISDSTSTSDSTPNTFSSSNTPLPSSSSSDNKKGNNSKFKEGNISIPRAPDKGCIAVVVRTGFATSQVLHIYDV